MKSSLRRINVKTMIYLSRMAAHLVTSAWPLPPLSAPQEEAVLLVAPMAAPAVQPHQMVLATMIQQLEVQLLSLEQLQVNIFDFI